MSLADAESQNAKWKTEKNRRETATGVQRIKMRKETANNERLIERTNTRRLITVLSRRASIV